MHVWYPIKNEADQPSRDDVFVQHNLHLYVQISHTVPSHFPNHTHTHTNTHARTHTLSNREKMTGGKNDRETEKEMGFERDSRVTVPNATRDRARRNWGP